MQDHDRVASVELEVTNQEQAVVFAGRSVVEVD
jgi:hypothetical protein